MGEFSKFRSEGEVGDFYAILAGLESGKFCIFIQFWAIYDNI